MGGLVITKPRVSPDELAAIIEVHQARKAEAKWGRRFNKPALAMVALDLEDAMFEIIRLEKLVEHFKTLWITKGTKPDDVLS